MKEVVDHLCLTQAEKSLPSQWYTAPSHFEKELTSIWQNQWIYVCSEHALDKLQYRTLEIGKNSIIVLRDSKLELKAYHNTCRHRGTKLLLEPEGRLRSNLIVCPYHQWPYAADTGALKGTTSVFTPKNFDKCDHGLFTIQLHVWHGLVFINLNQDAVWNQISVFQTYEDSITDVPMNRLTLGHTWRKVVNCNWKIYWENYSECLHCPSIHPELSKLVPVFSRGLNNIKEAPDWKERQHENHPKYSGGLKEGLETWSANGSAQGHPIKELVDHPDLAKGHSYLSTWPSMFIGVYADHVRTVRLLPIDQHSTELHVEWLFEKSAIEDPEYHIDNVTEFAKMVMEQDAYVSELNHQGLASSAFTEGVLMPEEYTIKAFHDWLKVHINA